MRRLIRLAALAGLAAATLAPLPALADKALVIGIDRYADSRLMLPGDGRSSAADAAAIAELLVDSLGYAKDDVRVLVDAAATRAAIMDGLASWLVAGTRPGERVFLYFSGQGYFQKDDSGDEADGLDETLVPYDAAVEAGDPPGIRGMIIDDEIVATMRALEGRKVTIAIDAGHSGLVTAEAEPATPNAAVRAVVLGAKTRSLADDTAAQAQKAEGPPLDTGGLGPDIAVFTATSGGQAPLVAGGEGVFTRAFVDAIRDKGADTNRNGIVSDAEILAFLRDRAQAACAAAEDACPLGLTPTLGPAAAAGNTPYPGASPADGKLTADRILDYFARGNTVGIKLQQIPPSPIPVGTKNLRFRVTSPADGSLILLDLSDDGTLTQLFPNGFIRDRQRVGRIVADAPVTVPDDTYGIHFNATTPNSGTLIALVTTGPMDLPVTVKTRKIEVIPREQATQTFLPAIAAALDAPVDAAAETPTRSIDWSVATLRYQIVRK
jgi:hypothetical protein